MPRLGPGGRTAAVLRRSPPVFALPVDPRTELVLGEPRHAEEVNALVRRNQARLGRWEDWARQPASVPATREFLRSCLIGFADGHTIQTYIRRDGRLTGAVGLRLDPAAAAGEVGFWVDAGVEGTGVAYAAVTVLVAAGFTALGLARIQLRTAVGNVRARALAGRLGFVQEGVLRSAHVVGPVRHDLVVYARLAGVPGD